MRFARLGGQEEVPSSLKAVSEVLLQAPEIHCDHCKTSIEDAVRIIDGVQSVEVAISDATVKVAYDDARVDLGSIKKAIEEQGYVVFG
jgi:copper chaperone